MALVHPVHSSESQAANRSSKVHTMYSQKLSASASLQMLTTHLAPRSASQLPASMARLPMTAIMARRWKYAHAARTRRVMKSGSTVGLPAHQVVRQTASGLM